MTMAAIDKIYVNSYEECKEFKEWLLKQPKLKDKYGKEVSIYSYFFDWWDNPEYWTDKNSHHPIYSAPSYVDAYIIRNCPLNYIQKRLMLMYGHKTQEDINEMYYIVINRTPEEQKLIDEAEGEYPNKPISYWWLNKDDFKIIDGVITMSNVEKKSSYQKILDGELYISPSIEGTYEIGKHFKIIKRPFYQSKCNYPMTYKNRIKRHPNWEISVSNMYLWWHSKNKIGTWDFSTEFVTSEYSSSTAHCPSLKSIKRRILKWKLPVGTVITLSGKYVGEYYKICIKK